MNVYHFHNGSRGGVLSVIRNLCKFSINDDIKNHIIHVVNKNEIPNYTILPIDGAMTQQLLYYTPQNNFYHTCNQLAKLLPDNNALIVAHDWIELGMVSNLGLQNPVVQVLHGDFEYYYELAVKNQQFINAFICISPTIYKKLNLKLDVQEKRILYLNYPVPNLKKKIVKNGNLKIIYNVRNLTDHRKQFIKIIEIAKKLASDKHFFFTIIGEGYSQKTFFEIWPIELKNRVTYLGVITNENILELLPSQDIFLLPSLTEGMPVSLIEAMKAGVVPIVTNWDGAVDELIDYGTSGFYLNIGDVDGYVTLIKSLQNNRALLKTISNNCFVKANHYFNPLVNTQKFEDIFQKCKLSKENVNKAKKNYGSRLDQIWIPNLFVLKIRNIIKYIFTSKKFI